jgi:phage baseplate assembly protein W
MGADFLGVGWSFPIEVDDHHRAVMTKAEESIRQAIWLIVATAPGERVMRPEFGCGIHELVFAVNDANTARSAADRVREALIRWEPRINVLSVNAEESESGAVLYLNIQYRVRTTNNHFNLVFPFYLAGTR